MQRIMIIGSPGSGKSTLARTLGERLDLPVFYMDKEIHWLPGWVARPEEEKPSIVARIVANEKWVFEGSHSKTYQLRAARADVLIWLDVPISLRLYRIVWRAVRDRGHVRSDMHEDCPERLDMLPEFIRFILRTRRSTRQKQQALFDEAMCPKFRLTTLGSVRTFLGSL
ncbi:MAG: AAA family ATPase [Pseudomonadota bacterium]